MWRRKILFLILILLAGAGTTCSRNIDVPVEAVPPSQRASRTETPFTRVAERSEVPDSGESSSTSVAMADPASVYCVNIMGYEYTVIEGEKGQSGICKFPDGETCDAWAFLQGKCGQKYSYCARQGYGIKTVRGGNDPFSAEYAVCVNDNGEVVGSVAELSGLKQIVK